MEEKSICGRAASGIHYRRNGDRQNDLGGNFLGKGFRGLRCLDRGRSMPGAFRRRRGVFSRFGGFVASLRSARARASDGDSSPASSHLAGANAIAAGRIGPRTSQARNAGCGQGTHVARDLRRDRGVDDRNAAAAGARGSALERLLDGRFYQPSGAPPRTGAAVGAGDFPAGGIDRQEAPFARDRTGASRSPAQLAIAARVFD